MVQPYSGRSSRRTGYGYRGFGTPRPTGKRVASLRLADNDVFIIVEAPYDAGFTETLKSSIPQKKRLWDANDKAWFVVKDQLDKLTHILDQYYDEVILLGFPQQSIATDAWGKLYLTQGAPIEVIQAVYRVLAKKYHPDLGGDVEKMKQINAAYKELMGEFTNGD